MNSDTAEGELPQQITCEACGWEVVVEEGRYIRGLSPEWSAKARRSGHISATGCPVDAFEIRVVDP